MIWLLLALVAACFGLIVFFGAPYIPTHKAQTKLGLDLLDLKRGELMLELGAGDGRFLVGGAQRGWRVYGYELNPLLASWCWLKLRRYQNARIVVADYWRATWPADIRGIYIFGTDRELHQLSVKLKTMKRPIRVVSYGFKLPGHKPKRTQGGFFVYHLKA